MLLVVTTSFDVTVDLLIHRLGPEGVFRYNFDLWRDYRVDFGPQGFRIEDPVGRSIDGGRTTKMLWRKPARTKDLLPDQPLTDEERYCEEELWYVLREVVNDLWHQGKVVLVEPFVDIRVGKFRQAEVAARHFPVPPFRFGFGIPFGDWGSRPAVAKSLTSEPVRREGDYSVLFATRIDPRELSPAWPWLVQDYVEADLDVTVAFVRDRLFAFELDRRPFLARTADWRELAMEETTDHWRPHRLPEAVERGVFAFMETLELHFGRLDFLYADGRHYFLEVNPNGQWAWLDAEDRHGLLGKIVEEISPVTPCHPIPVRRP